MEGLGAVVGLLTLRDCRNIPPGNKVSVNTQDQFKSNKNSVPGPINLKLYFPSNLQNRRQKRGSLARILFARVVSFLNIGTFEN